MINQLVIILVDNLSQNVANFILQNIVERVQYAPLNQLVQQISLLKCRMDFFMERLRELH